VFLAFSSKSALLPCAQCCGSEIINSGFEYGSYISSHSGSESCLKIRPMQDPKQCTIRSISVQDPAHYISDYRDFITLWWSSVRKK
jgi:hypothetical protein